MGIRIICWSMKHFAPSKGKIRGPRLNAHLMSDWECVVPRIVYWFEGDDVRVFTKAIPAGKYQAVYSIRCPHCRDNVQISHSDLQKLAPLLRPLPDRGDGKLALLQFAHPYRLDFPSLKSKSEVKS